MSLSPNKALFAAPFWHCFLGQHYTQLSSSAQGLSTVEAELRLERYGADRLNNTPRGGYC